MSSGLSAKARYYNNQAKKGNISQSQASSAIAGKGLSSSKSSSSKISSPAPLVGAGPLLPGQTRSSMYAGPSLPGQAGAGYYDYSTNTANAYNEPSSKSKSSSKSSGGSNRSVAATAINTGNSLAGGLFGTPTAQASTPKYGYGTITQGQAPSLISQALGAAGSGWEHLLGGLFGNKGQVLGASDTKAPAADQPTGYGQNGEIYYNGNTGQIPFTFQSDFATPGTNFSRPGSEQANNNGINPLTYGVQQQQAQQNYGSRPVNVSPANYVPHQVSSPTPNYAPPTLSGNQGTNLSSLLSLLSGNVSSNVPNTPDVNNGYAPPTPTNQGTVRQFLGNGALSGGMASNGGFSGIQGTLGTGTQDPNSVINDLMSLFGNTANAETLPMAGNIGIGSNAPQSNMSIGGFSMPQNSFSGSNNLPMSSMDNVTPSATYNGISNPVTAPKIGGNQGNPNTSVNQNTQPQVQTAGTVAQGASNDPLMNYYNNQDKGYKAQEKAQKNALDELIKSIKSQYSTANDKGTNDLNTAKQQDLLKLSGLFSFANQSPDSEQRVQYEQRANNDYAKQLADFLTTQGQSQNQAISQAKQGYQSQLANIAQQRNATSLEIAKLQSAAQQAALTRASKGGAAQKIPGVNAPWATYQVQNFVNGMLNSKNPQTGQPYSWQDVADTAQANGIDATSGSYFDNYMRNRNGLGRINNYGVNPSDPYGIGI